MNVAIIIFILKAYVKCHSPTGSQKQCRRLGCCSYPTPQNAEANGRRDGDKEVGGGEERG